MVGLHLEEQFWNKGCNFVAGTDEVGRGAFAGPVVTGIVIFRKDFGVDSDLLAKSKVVIRDSKKLTQNARFRASKWIKDNALIWAIGEANVEEINGYGIVNALNLAYKRCVKKIQKEIAIEHLLTDAFYIPKLPGVPTNRQTAIVKGDNISFSIAAASIIAKVTRDNMMVELAKEHPRYFWHKNKGYGTTKHREAIFKYGLTKYHRNWSI